VIPALLGGLFLLVSTVIGVGWSALSGLLNRVDRLEDRERVRDDYIIQLRQHILEEKPPPPPPYPIGLITNASQ
jgi:hypothetical protein